MIRLVFFSLLVILSSCKDEDKHERGAEIYSIKEEVIPVKYSQGFSISQFSDYKIITLNNAWIGEKSLYKYVLYQNEKPSNIKNAIFVKTPIKSIACMSLTHVAFLEKLGLEESIIALSGCDYVSSKNINLQIKNNRIKEIGKEQNINYEMLVDKEPDIIMGYGIDASSNNFIKKLEKLGLKVVLNAEYMETHPLGKAEWIKFIAAFYNKDDEAASTFDKIEKEYLLLTELTKDIKDKPTVFTGMPWNGAWYIPGGASFQVKLFKDAGANYLWLSNTETSSLVKSKEIIIDEAYNADYWLNLNSYNSINAVTSFDKKFSEFKAIKNKNLYNNDKRLNITGGNDYWESGVVNPQLVLKDLIKIFHPELIDHHFYYYRKLE